MKGVLIFYNRPKYLEKVVRSLEENTIQLDWYFLQDGPPDAKTDECQNVIKNSSLTGEIYQSEKNISPLGQNLRMLSLCKKHDQVFIFEDDMIVSPYYISLLNRIYNQFPNSVILGTDYPKKPNSEPHLINKLDTKPWNLWGYLLPATVGIRIMPHIEEYVNFLFDCVNTNDLSIALRKRPHDLIRRKYEVQATGIDAIIHQAIAKEGFEIINTVVPRGKYIGVYGYNKTANTYMRMNFHNFKEYVFEKDKYLNHFEFI